MQRSIKRYISNYIELILIAGSIVALDQYTKSLVRQNIPLGGTWMPLEWLSPYARIVNWFNTGAAFGLFKNGSLFFTVLAIIVMLLILFYFPRIPKTEWIYRTALIMQFAGAAGNFIDRIQFEGKVTDFISVGNFAVFNVADASITIGCFVLLLGSWLNDRKAKIENVEDKLISEHHPQNSAKEIDG